MYLILTRKKRKIKIEFVKCGFLRKIFGLMFQRRKNAKALLFEFKKPIRGSIHSYFVFFNFLLVFFNEDNGILEIKMVKPFQIISSPPKFSKFLEIPNNSQCKNAIDLIVNS